MQVLNELFTSAATTLRCRSVNVPKHSESPQGTELCDLVKSSYDHPFKCSISTFESDKVVPFQDEHIAASLTLIQKSRLKTEG